MGTLAKVFLALIFVELLFVFLGASEALFISSQEQTEVNLEIPDIQPSKVNYRGTKIDGLLPDGQTASYEVPTRAAQNLERGQKAKLLFRRPVGNLTGIKYRTQMTGWESVEQ